MAFFESIIGASSNNGNANIISGTSTPTPSIGNNGDIYIYYRDYTQYSGILPDEYALLSYIQSPRKSTIDTELQPTTKTSAEIQLHTHTSYIQENPMLSISWSGSGYLLMFYNSKIRWHTGSTIDVPFDLDTDYTIQIDNSSMTVNGTKYTSSTGSYVTGTIKVFANAGRYSYYKLYHLKFWDDSILVRDFYPAMRKSDKALGLYDIVNNKFHTNTGTDALIAGEILDGTPIQAEYVKVNNVWTLLDEANLTDIRTQDSPTHTNQAFYFCINTDQKSYSSSGNHNYSYTITQSDISYGDYLLIIMSGTDNTITNLTFDGSDLTQIALDTANNIKLNAYLIPCTEDNVGKTITKTGTGIFAINVITLFFSKQFSLLSAAQVDRKYSDSNGSYTLTYTITQEDIENSQYILIITGVAGIYGSSSGNVGRGEFAGILGQQLALNSVNNQHSNAGFAAYIVPCIEQNLNKTVTINGYSQYVSQKIRLN